MAAMATKANVDPVTQRPVPGQSQVIAGTPPSSDGMSGISGAPAGPSRVLQGQQSTDPYRSNLNTNFQGIADPGQRTVNDYSNDSDSDVRAAQGLTNELSRAYAGQNQGMDQVAGKAQLDAILARIGQRNALGSSIKANAGMESQAEDQDRYAANQALGQGIKNTRQNFNNRGLLYSGLRQGGEASVRSGIASKLGGDLANTKRDYSNLATSQKEAYAALGQAQEQQRLERANETFDTVTKNNVARAQAYQQLGQGLGGIAGMYAGSQKPGGQATTTTPMQPNSYQFAGTGSGDGFGGSQMSASNDDSFWRTS